LKTDGGVEACNIVWNGFKAWFDVESGLSLSSRVGYSLRRGAGRVIECLQADEIIGP
jgi:hypothetical protein